MKVKIFVGINRNHYLTAHSCNSLETQINEFLNTIISAGHSVSNIIQSQEENTITISIWYK